MNNAKTKNELLTAIARQHFGSKVMDRKIQAALEAAYKAGKSAATKRQNPDYNHSKHQILIDMLRSDAGTTLQQMADATGWKKHSVSCALSAVLKTKWKFDIITIRQAGKACVYRINQQKE